MKKMQETIDLLKREAAESGSVTLSKDLTNKLVELLTLADKLITDQGKFIEEMKQDMFHIGKDGVVKDKSW